MGVVSRVCWRGLVTEALLTDLRIIKHTYMTLVKRITIFPKDPFSNRRYGAVEKLVTLVDKGLFD